MPYHNLGESKYKALGRKYELEEVNPPEDEFIRERVKIANKVLKPVSYTHLDVYKRQLQNCSGTSGTDFPAGMSDGMAYSSLHLP